ncbi:hypothetical protein NBM05_02920 [Rothia sp. AR01]|uniref:Uncharacterized protein n=1 Tax=Rothia santali TaxID=2949643 RepID=A0A9X2HB77_9MICC|nr:hypothetical protein [Rothia santali]MCP3425010.1 hypothetical protein [Rothia santali]
MGSASRTANSSWRVATGCFTVVLGVSAALLAWPGLRSSLPATPVLSWALWSLGPLTVLMGVWLVRGRWRGRALVLSGHPWKIWLGVGTIAVLLTCFVVLARPIPGRSGEDVGPLVLPGSIAVAIAGCLCLLFLPDGAEEPRFQGPLRLTAARRRKAYRLLPLCGLAGVVIMAASFALAWWDVVPGASAGMGSGLVVVVMTCVQLRRVRAAEIVDETPGSPPDGTAHDAA